MHRCLRVVALACALSSTPACAALQLGQTRIENPVAAAHTIDQRAYALLNAYAAIVEEATDIVRSPAAPPAFKHSLAQAERLATPAVETLQIAVTAYVRARADYEVASRADQSALNRAASALSIAARRLSEAIAAAQDPISNLETIVRARRS